MEPFVSEDNHEKLVQFGESSGRPVIVAHFCHPAFLKSALMAFRKLWLSSETCAFDTIRNLVFEKHPNQNEPAGYRHWFYGLYLNQLDQPADGKWAKESRRDILNIWIYTQAVHAGKKQSGFGQFTLQDFDQWAERIGRERFEFLFRSSLRVISGVYVQFLAKLARPLFALLQRDYNMAPGFEAAATLKYSPYPDPRYRISFDDVFWHLDKETMEETFDRLLERHTFAILKSFLVAYFESKADALASICEDASFAAMLERTGGVRLKSAEVVEEQLMCEYSVMWGTAFGPIRFQVYRGRKVRFLEGAGGKFAEAYATFRNCLFEELKRQRRERWGAW